MNTVRGYRILQSKTLPELGAIGTELIHERSGAHFCCIEKPDDSNKVFTIGFTTPPENDKGIPHILEHSVLCGSEKYPLKDPFVELAQGSLNTFLNAMTYPEKTLYPVASQNGQDLKNLIDVYMDAVFHPNIRKDGRILMQEGWHYEMEDPESPLGLTGVVYNEMKGAYSSSESVLYRGISHSLFPDTPYAFESGGLPSAIPQLSEEEFLSFYHRYYQASNAYVYLYGDMDMEEYLTWLDEAYFSKFTLQAGYDPKRLLPKAAVFTERCDVTYPFSADEENEDNEGCLSYNVSIDDFTPETVLALDVLEYMLLEIQSAPLKKALLDAGLGQNVYGMTDSCGHHVVFSVIARGVDPNRKEEFIQIVENTLKDAAREGFTQRQKLATLNRIEFSLKESDHGSTPEGLFKGLSYIYPFWMYGEDPFQYLSLGELLTQIRRDGEEGLFESMIRDLLLNNPHKACIALEPAAGLAAAEEQELARQLQKKKETMTEAEIAALVEETAALHAYQSEPDDLDQVKVPHLKVSDVRREVEKLEVETIQKSLPMLYAPALTNGILYTKLYFDLTGLSNADLARVSFLGSLLGNLDTDRYSYEEWSNEVHIHTGGISMDASVLRRRDGFFRPELIISGKCLENEEQNMMALIAEALLHTRFESVKRFREKVSEEYESLHSEIENGGYSTAMGRAMAHLKSSSMLDEQMNGLEYYAYIRELNQHIEERAEEELKALKALCRRVFVQKRLSLGGGGLAQSKERLYEANCAFYALLPAGDPEDLSALPVGEPDLRNEGLLYPGKILYNIYAGTFRTPFGGTVNVASQILSLDFLWNRLRVQGGAYGAFAGFDRFAKTVYLSSYRDPNLEETYAVYDQTADFFRNFSCTPDELEKFILGTIGSMDTPLTPSTRVRLCLNLYRRDMIDEGRRQKLRDEVLNTTVDDLRKMAVLFDEAAENCVCCSLGNRDKIAASADRFDVTYDVLSEGPLT